LALVAVIKTTIAIGYLVGKAVSTIEVGSWRVGQRTIGVVDQKVPWYEDTVVEVWGISSTSLSFLLDQQ